LGQLSHAWGVSLLLNDNQLSGEIPPELGSNMLGMLHLQNNRLSGEIPSSFVNLTLMSDLNLQNNLLTGEIPSFFGVELGMKSSEHAQVKINLGHNQFTGTIPTSLGNNTNTKIAKINLGFNQLTGESLDLISHR
jgi:hypothetical protein